MERNFPLTLLSACTTALLSFPRHIGAWLIKAWHGRRWSLSYYKSEYPLGSLILGIVVISLLIPLFN